MPTTLSTRAQVTDFIDKHETFLFDCDGVLWLGTTLLPKIKETLNLLREKGKKLIFVTNNATNSREQYVEKFAKFGIAVKKEEVFGSAFSAATYVEKIVKLPKDKKVWVLGQKGLEHELHELGYQTLGGTDPELSTPWSTSNKLMKLDPTVGAAVVGLTTDINYYRLAVTLQYLLKPDVEFIATNIDSTFPANGMILPGAGTVVECVTTCSNRKPVACGKPSQAMMDAIKATVDFDESKACMVGDRLNTDIRFGNKGGLDTLLVLTGIETEATVAVAEGEEKPKFVASKLGDLYELIQ